MNNYFKWDLGESKKIRLDVFSNVKNDVFSIISATFKLSKKNIEVESGICEIQGTMISAHLNPIEKGDHELVITYCIADEIFIEKSVIKVC